MTTMKWKAAAVAVAILPVSAAAGQENIDSDRAALEALYHATDGPNWSSSEGWLTEEPLGLWHGVSVGAGRVTEVRLAGNNLSGSIPAELGRLGQLTFLNLDDNNLSGPIPAELGQLNQLTTGLSLNGNNLSGPIPAELGQLSRSTYLGLAHNNLTGPIPPELGQLSRLRVLHLPRNNLSGPIPAELGRLVDELWNLNLLGNNLSGPIPAELGQLDQLTDLLLSFNNLSGPIPAELGQLDRLRGLAIFGNSLSGPIPAELGQLDQLTSLALGNNNLSGPIPAELGQLDQLASLWLSGNSLSGPIPAELGQLDQLELLWLHGNSLSGPIPAELGQLTNLQELNIDNDTGLCLARDFDLTSPFATQSGLSICSTAPLNRVPVPVGRLAPVTLATDESAVTVDVSAAFRDPDGDALTYQATSSAPSVASVTVVGSTVTVAPVSEGAATVTVTATDAGGSNGTATQAFSVTVSRQRPPGACTVEVLGTLTGTVTRTGTLADDCVSPNFSGELARFYSFMLETAAAVEIDLVLDGVRCVAGATRGRGRGWACVGPGRRRRSGYELAHRHGAVGGDVHDRGDVLRAR